MIPTRLTRAPAFRAEGCRGSFRGGHISASRTIPEVSSRIVSKSRKIFIWSVCFYYMVCLVACASRPIPLGLSVELTGRRAELGVAVRNGAQLAVDQINESGGVNGRPLELIVRDDRGDPETARQVDAELVEDGAVAIIGHITSSLTEAALEQDNRAGIVLLSPTSSSSAFSAQADYLFRVTPSNDAMARSLAAYIYNQRGVRELVGIYDLGNRSFSETLWQEMQAEFRRLGGAADESFTFTSGETDLQNLMSQVKERNPQAVVFIASAVDTALLVQYAKQQGLESSLFSSTWAQTDELLEKGGQAVEGLELGAVYDPQHPSPAYQQFVQDFEARFGRPPALGASHAYEAVLVLVEALKRTKGQREGLPDALSKVQDLPGLQGLISMDEYGDVQRDFYIVRVEDRQFKVISTISLEK